MANELQKIADDYYNRNKALATEYRDYMGKQVEAVGTDITSSLDNVAQMQQAQILSQVASTNVLDQTLQQGFTGMSNQLGSMTASFSMGFARLENALDKMTDIMNNPLLAQSRELYRRAADRSKKGQFEEALEDLMAALEKDKTDYTAWFLQGKIYAFGASKYSNVIDLDKSIDALTKAAKYNEPNIEDSADALKRQAEIYFYLGIAYYAKSNDQLRENKKTESSETLALARKSFEQSYKYSDGMLESLFNIARCKIIQGETAGALRDLETLVPRERNYCIKVCADADFSSIGEQFSNLINKLKKPIFISAKSDYDQINTLLSELTSIGGHTNEKVPSSFSETLPYFDILDYADDFKRIIPIVEKALIEKNAAIAEANQKTREAKRKAEREAREAKEAAERAAEREVREAERRAEEKAKAAKERRRYIIISLISVFFALLPAVLCIILINTNPKGMNDNAGMAPLLFIVTFIPFLIIFFASNMGIVGKIIWMVIGILISVGLSFALKEALIEGPHYVIYEKEGSFYTEVLVGEEASSVLKIMPIVYFICNTLSYIIALIVRERG